MRRQRALRVTQLDRPFVRAFPRAAMTVMFTVALLRAAGAVVSVLWPYRRELLTATVLCGLWCEVGAIVPGWWSLPVTVVLVATAMTAGPVRRGVWGWLAGGWTRRRLRAAFVQTRSTDLDGRPPRVMRVSITPVGERLWLRLRPGQSFEQLDPRSEEFRAAVRARDVRLTRDVRRANRVVVDVVRRDTLTGGPVLWPDRHAEVLSIWDPVYFGISELGTAVRLSLVERAVLMGGNRGAGKSNGINVLVSHAALSPDVELLLIDANRVQLGPFADRALAFADHRIDDAIDVVRLWRDEIDHRLALMATLPGLPVSLSRGLSVEHGLPMWLLVVDELAYHTSVAGTRAQQTEFYNVMRDGVARGRAAGMGIVVATQRPTHDVVPTSLRDLFDIRIAYRTMTRTSSDVILGDEYARSGYSATDIDLTARGVCWVFAEGPAPVRTKTVWIPPELRTELAVTTIRNRPTPRDARPGLPSRERDGKELP
jgi:hypothetical protein